MSKNINKEQIDKWKKEHKRVHKLEIEGHVGFLKHPNRNVLGLAMSYSSQGNNVKFAECLFENCWLGGDEILRNDDDFFISCIPQLSEIVVIKEGKLTRV